MTYARSIGCAALAALALGCRGSGGAQAAAEPAPATAEAAAESVSQVPESPATPPERQVLIGAMCPEAIGGRAGVVPLVARELRWIVDRGPVSDRVLRREARQFSVLAWDGRRAGVFSAAGMADAAAIGAYAGAEPCARAGEQALIPECVRATGGCGIALALLEPSGGLEARPYEEDAEPMSVDTAGACVAGGRVVVDVDGDGEREVFSASGLGSSELSALREPAPACDPAFAAAAVTTGVDLLGVLDVDGDQRYELIAQRRTGSGRAWLIYAAPDTPARLELVAEAALR